MVKSGSKFFIALRVWARERNIHIATHESNRFSEYSQWRREPTTGIAYWPPREDAMHEDSLEIFIDKAVPFEHIETVMATCLLAYAPTKLKFTIYVVSRN
jgi:hypothetical protein